MRVGIDACTWTNRRGYGRFTRELVTAMIRSYPQHEFVLVLDQQTAAEGEFPERAQRVVVRTSQQSTQAASAEGSRSLLDLWRMGRAATKGHFDAFFFPTRYSFFPLLGSTPVVVAFHDATGEQHPELIFPSFRSRLFWRIKTRLAFRRADRVVTVSEDARRQIAGVFDCPPDEIAVISEGPNRMFRPLADPDKAAIVRQRLELPPDVPLLLYVGGISPHKNLQSLLRALVKLPGPWHAVLVGDYETDSFWGCYEELVELGRELGLDERITFTGYTSDEDLVLLYNEATLLVLPSMSEGFGLPVVEAMASGLPVAASNRNSIPEVLGDAGLLFDPTSTEEITAALVRLLEDAGLREQCRSRGLARSELFSWDRGAEQLMSILEDLHRD